ncbi:MAG: LysR family transcriptional regulator [Verrucomicrobiota bacterium JB023]|nr:LysR family transcriptional regulator [Verrucomicrobiota bacterium JB023]
MFLLKGAMDLRRLQYFLEVAEEENISQAARKLGMTQPALSRQVRALEDDFGFPLLERGGKAVRLTKAGHVVQREGKRVLRSVRMAHERILRDVRGTELRIGYAPSLAGGLVEQAMAIVTQRHPDVRVRLLDSSTDEMMGRLRGEELELVIEVVTNERDIQWEILLERGFRLAVPLGHPLARRRVVPASELDGERLLLFSRAEYPGYWSGVSEFFANAEINAKVAGEFDGIESLRMGIEAGLGIALVAEGSRLGDSVKVLRIKPDPEPVRVGVGWLSRRKLDAWEESFVSELGRAAKLVS